MKREEIRSDRARKLLMSRTLRTAAQQGPFGSGLVEPDLITQATELDAGFRGMLGALSLQFSNRRQLVEDCTEAITTLSAMVRQFWRGLEFRGQLMNISSGVLEIYRLPSDGGRPQPTTQPGWLEVANELVEGEKKAVEAGYPPMDNPSIDTVSTPLAKARKRCGKADDAHLAYMATQKELHALRDQVDQLIMDLAANLNYNLSKMPAATRRQVMRRYGFNYRGETLTTDETSSETQNPEPTLPTSPQFATSA